MSPLADAHSMPVQIRCAPTAHLDCFVGLHLHMCVFVCVHVHGFVCMLVSTPKAAKNQWCDVVRY